MRSRRPFLTGTSSAPVVRDLARRASYIERAEANVDVTFVTPEDEKRKRIRRRRLFQSGPEMPEGS